MRSREDDDDDAPPKTGIWSLLSTWFELGPMLVTMAIGIPIFLAIGIVLAVLPIAYLVLAFHAEWYLTAYLLAVFAGVVSFFAFRLWNTRDPEPPIRGSRVISQEKAVHRARSQFQLPTKSARRRS